MIQTSSFGDRKQHRTSNRHRNSLQLKPARKLAFLHGGPSFAPYSAAISRAADRVLVSNKRKTSLKRRCPSGLSLPVAATVAWTKSAKARRASVGTSCGRASIAARSSTARIAHCSRTAALNSAGETSGWRQKQLAQGSRRCARRCDAGPCRHRPTPVPQHRAALPSRNPSLQATFLLLGYRQD